MALPTLSVALGAWIQIAGLHVSFANLHDRLEGALGNAGVFGILAFAGLAVSLHEFVRTQRLVLIPPIAVNLTFVVFSGSRGALLASGILLIAYLLTSHPLRAQLRQRPLAMLGGVVLAGAASAAYLPKLIERLHLHPDRLGMWKVFYRDWLLSPIFGRGVGAGFVGGADWPADIEEPMFAVPHNEYLHLLVNGGVVGFALCASAIAYWYCRLVLSASDEDRPFLIALLPALGIFAVTENVLIHASALALFAYLGLIDRRRTSGALKSTEGCAPIELAGRAAPRRQSV
jgi:O-antigen ligase